MDSRPQSTFTTPALVAQQEFEVVATPTPGNEATEWADWYTLVRRYCFDYSKILEEQIGRTFVPYTATKTDYFRDLWLNGEFYREGGAYVYHLPDDLLEVSTITANSTSVGSSVYRVQGAEYPYRTLLFDPDTFPSFDYDFDTSLIVAGVWGVADDPNKLYVVTDALNGLVNATTTELTLDNVDDFQVYQYIRIDSELMFITAIDTDNEKLTVERGVNGYTAASHDDDSDVEVWQVVYDVQELATRMVAYHMKRRTDLGESVQVFDQSVVVPQFAEDLRKVISRRAWNRVGAV
jgi:hypothetical protein